MKITCTNFRTLFFMLTLLSLRVAGQETQDTNREIQVQNQKIAELKIQLLELEKKQAEGKNKVTAAIREAEELTGELNTATSQVARSPQDKKLNNELKKADRASKKADRQARKANEELAEIETKITTTQQLIDTETTRLGILSGATASSADYGRNISPTTQVDTTSNQTSTAQANPALTSAVQENPANSQMIRRVVEDTYKNYPQQAGQPNIIINNIIVPSDYNPQAYQNRRNVGSASDLSAEELAEFRAWRQSQYASYPNRASRRSYPARYDLHEEPMHYEHRDNSSFRNRFAELPNKRKSGLWVIPLVGAHASSFEMDFDNNEAKGRGGWNAGLDFRAHFNRFFIQPGAHYFSSSMDVSTSDSLTTTPFTKGPRIHSLRVPVLAGIYLTKAQGAFFKFNVKGGIVGNYILSVDRNDRNLTLDNFERYSYGVNGGIGIEFGFLTIDLSHEWGISRFFQNSDAKNNMLRATVGFKL